MHRWGGYPADARHMPTIRDELLSILVSGRKEGQSPLVSIQAPKFVPPSDSMFENGIRAHTGSVLLSVVRSTVLTRALPL